MRFKRAGETTERMLCDSEVLCDYICYTCAIKLGRYAGEYPTGKFDLDGDPVIKTYKRPSWEMLTDTGDTMTGMEEVDSPVHCSVCGTLFVTSLTTDGAAYVNKKVKEADGDPVILKLWAEEFSWAIEDNNEEEEDGQED